MSKSKSRNKKKPQPTRQLPTLQSNNQNASITFDYRSLLSKYNKEEIDKSVVKYYEAVQTWINELLEKIDEIESKKESVVNALNLTTVKLNKKYKSNDALTDEENNILQARHDFLAENYSVRMDIVKNKLLSIKEQATNIEKRIADIISGNDAIQQLALLEKEERVSFGFLADITAKIVRDSLKRIEFFESEQSYVEWVVKKSEAWATKYKKYKTTDYKKFGEICKEEVIDKKNSNRIFKEWQELRLKIESKLQAILEKESQSHIYIKDNNEFAVQQIISELEKYRNSIDSLYLNERKERLSIYQRYAHRENKDTLEEICTKGRIYELTYSFQKAILSIIDNCCKSEDKVFILRWADDILNFQIDSILFAISDSKFDSISMIIIDEFSEIRKTNYEILLSDAEEFSRALERRNDEVQSLIYKMRKGLGDNDE